MSEVILTSLLEDRKSLFQATLTRELLSWERVTSSGSAASAASSGGGWGASHRLKERDIILTAAQQQQQQSSNDSARTQTASVVTDVNSRRSVATNLIIGVTFVEPPVNKKGGKRTTSKAKTTTTTTNPSFSIPVGGESVSRRDPAHDSGFDSGALSPAADSRTLSPVPDSRALLPGAVSRTLLSDLLTGSGFEPRFSPNSGAKSLEASVAVVKERRGLTTDSAALKAQDATSFAREDSTAFFSLPSPIPAAAADFASNASPASPLATSTPTPDAAAAAAAALSAPSPPSLTFAVHVARPIGGRKWRYATYTFTCFDGFTCRKWVDRIKEIVAEERERPRRIFVLLNPYGGKGRGPRIFHRKVEPIFDLAGIAVTVVETQFAGHGIDVVGKLDLDSFDGVVAVGGDGTFNEMANALIRRVNLAAKVDLHDPDAAVRALRIPLGIIPCGSTDCMAYSVLGNNDPETCAIQVVLGKTVSLDVAAVHHRRQLLRYSFTFMGYGYYGDVLLNSEKYRCLGPGRYNLAGFKKLLTFDSYEGEVTFLPSGNSQSHPGDGVVCYSGCEVCGGGVAEEDHDDEAPIALTPSPSDGEALLSPEDAGIAGVTGIRLNFDSDFRRPGARLSVSSLGTKTTTSNANRGGGKDDDLLEPKRPDTLQLGPKRSSSRSSNEWVSVRGKFIGVNCIMMSARCGLCPDGLSPYGHLGDGCMDLMLASECSRFTYLRHLINCARHNVNQLDFHFVKVFRVKAFKFRPKNIDAGGLLDACACPKRTSTPATTPTPTPVSDDAGTRDDLNLIPSDNAETPAPSCGVGSVVGTCAEVGCGACSKRRAQFRSTVKNSVWNCDGETVHEAAVDVRMHRRIVRIFGCGVPDPRIDLEAAVPGCEEPRRHCYNFSR